MIESEKMIEPFLAIAYRDPFANGRIDNNKGVYLKMDFTDTFED